jgi:diguanylate cyclase (GGDEF)-like protein
VAAPNNHTRMRARVSALVADDRPDAERLTGELRVLRERDGSPTFSIVLHLLTHLDLPDGQAEQVFVDLLRHREAVRRALGRDPGVRVATIDYLSNVKRLLTNPTIVESAHLERTERSAVTDALTGLSNRRHFSNCLGLEVRRSRRYGLRLSLLMLDLDEFKRLNDRDGHLFGDLVLQRVGRVLRRAVREADVACRYGGEEFAVILPETDRLGGYAVAERIRKRIEQDFSERPIGNRRVRLGVSGGIGSYPEDAQDAARLIDRADQALYLSKRRGKNRISLYHSERRESIRYPARASARASVSVAGGEPRRALPVNLSRRGALLELPADCRPEELLELTLGGRDPAGRPRTWVRQGRVVRVEAEPVAEGSCRVAVCFEKPLSDECLEQQVRRGQPLRAAAGGGS